MARPGDAAAAWHDDGDVEMKESLHQKEAITAQMISIISTRLNSLQTVANNRKLGLECDLRVNSDYCSKMVPGLQDPYETRVGTSGKTKTISSTAIASNQAMMERLFGPDEKTRLRTQILKKNKLELQKNENRRNARVLLEKQLQASIEGHITRTVESFTYTGGDAESGCSSSRNARVYVNAKLLLLHTLERMRIANGKKSFKRFLLADVSCTLFEEVFWLAFCHFYQKRSLPQQRALVEELSAKYVKMIASLHGNIDYIFRIYPYAIASAVCWGFYYLFPGSRHLYSTEFKNEIYLFVCQLLLGLKLCPVSVQSMRRQYFPDEVLDDVSSKSKAPKPPLSAPSANAMSLTGDVAFLPRIQSAAAAFGVESNGGAAKIKKSASESYLGKQALNDNTIERILEVPPTVSDDSSTSNTAAQRRTHQLRSMFNASQLSPLMKEYFGSQTKSLKKPCYLLRTTPLEGCHVGGEDTYHKYYRRKNQKNYAAEALKEQEKCYREIHKVQSDTRREIDALHETREVVLNSGKKALQAYCTLLITKKHAAEEEDAQTSAAATTTASSSPLARAKS